jgi:hypothetical protein
MPERRTRTRVKIQYRADVSTSGASLVDLETRDLSHKGVFILGEHSLEAGQPCRVTIYLSGEPEKTPAMHMEGKVVRSTADGTAIDFDNMDPDTYVHMRSLVLRNVPDPDEVEREFGTPAFPDLPAGEKQ